MNKCFTLRLYPRCYLQNMVAPTKTISAIDMSYLVSVVTHLYWPGFLETFLSFCSLQQFQVKLNMNTRELKWLSL